MQNDPYDQFASGYVGMGNDPVNNIDPSGGFIGPGFQTIGGFWNGSFLSQIGSGFSLGINVSANAMSWAGIAMKAISLTSQGISLGQNIRGHNQNARQSEGQKSEGVGDANGDQSPFSPFKNKNLPIGESFFGLPILYVYEEEMPVTFAHIVKAMTVDAKPMLLTYKKGIGKSNRKELFKDPDIKDMGQDIDNWRDEYPFASTLEGGPGASVLLTPAWEQKVQRDQLRMFYKQFIPSGNGKFLVIPIFKKNEPKPKEIPGTQFFPGLLEKFFQRFLPPILIPEGIDFGPSRLSPDFTL